MQTLESSKLARRLGEVLRLARDGETVLVTRYGRALAVIGPPPAEPLIGEVADPGVHPAALADPGVDARRRQAGRDELLNRIRR